jgi:hypothetical protein
MKQTTKSLVGLLALALVGIAVAFGAAWAGRDEEKKTEAKEKAEKLFDFDKAHVTGLRIVKDGATVSLAKADRWKLTAPVQADGDEGAITSLIDALSRLKQKKELEGTNDPKNFGLDKPQLTVAVKLEDGKEQGLDFGETNSFDNSLYVRKLGDATIREVESYAKTQFEKSAFDLRNKLVAGVTGELKSIEVGAVKLEKDGAAWKVNGQLADSAAAEKVANAIKNLRATGVASENSTLPAEFGLDLPKAVVKYDAHALTIGQPAPAKGSVAVKTYAKREDSPVVYEIDKQFLKDVEVDQAALIDKTLAKVDREAIRKIALESPQGKLFIERTRPAPADGGVGEEQFTVDGKPAKKWKISSALYTLGSLKASSFEGPVPKDLAKFDKSVKLLGDGDKVLLSLRAGPEKDGKRPVVVEGNPKLALVEKSAIDDLPWTPADALEAPAAAASK